MSVTPLTLLHTSLSGMLSNQFAMDVIADNIANVNTPGFRPSRSDFQELLDQNADDGLVSGPYRGSAPGVTRLSVSPGALKPGESPLELAIEGEGFFQIQQPDGTTAYTRDGHFMRDADGNLVTASGQFVVWEGTLPTDETAAMHVNPDGTVMSMVNGEWTQVGALQTVRFANPSGLLKLQSNLYSPSEDSGDPETGTPGTTGFGQILSGVQEMSAANLGDEMSNAVLAQRAYSLSLKAFTQADDMISLAIHLRR